MLPSHPHHSPPMVLDPNGLLHPMPNISTNATMLYYASTISSPANYTYFAACISSLRRFKDDMRLAILFFASYVTISHIRHPWKNLGHALVVFLRFRNSSLSIFESSIEYHALQQELFSQVQVSSRIIKVRENPFLLILNFE